MLATTIGLLSLLTTAAPYAGPAVPPAAPSAPPIEPYAQPPESPGEPYFEPQATPAEPYAQPTAPPAALALSAAPAPSASRTAIRANAMIHGFDFTGIGGEVSHSFDNSFAVEASLDSADLSRGITGTYMQSLARVGTFGGNHAVSFGAGLGLLSGSVFGPVSFAVEEMTYEYRPRGGLSLAVGFGFPITLNNSKDVPCEDGGWFGCFLEKTQFHRGEITPRMRVALGYSF